MAGLRKGLMAGLFTLLPYMVSTGEGVSDDFSESNSKLENTVVENSFQDGSKHVSSKVNFDTVYLDNGGKKIISYVRRGEKGDYGAIDSTSCTCIDDNNDGFFETSSVTKNISARFSDGDVVNEVTNYYVSEIFNVSRNYGKVFPESYEAGIMFIGKPPGAENFHSEYIDSGFYEYGSLESFDLPEEFYRRFGNVSRACNEKDYGLRDFVLNEFRNQDYWVLSKGSRIGPGRYPEKGFELNNSIPKEIFRDFYDSGATTMYGLELSIGD